MNADRLNWWVRDWLNSRAGHREICVHLRSSAAKIPFFLITQPQPDASQEGPGPAHPHPAAPAAVTPFKPSRIDPLNREPPVAFKSPRIEPVDSQPAAPFKPFRIDPLNREPKAKPSATAPSKPSRIDPLNREPPVAFKSPRIESVSPKPAAPLKPSRTDPLNREPATKSSPTAPFKPFRTDPLNLIPPRWRPVNRAARRRPPTPMTQHRAQGNRVKRASSGRCPDLASFTRHPCDGCRTGFPTRHKPGDHGIPHPDNPEDA